jgi:hypothetical protein
MKTERLLQSGILNSGEPRHYASWDLPTRPRLVMTALDPSPRPIPFRRARSAASRVAKRSLWASLFRGRVA